MLNVGNVVDYTFADFFFIKGDTVVAVAEETVDFRAANGDIHTIQRVDISEVVVVKEA